MKFKVGDKVCYKHPNPNDNVEVGEVGTICGISEVTGNYGVAFETKDIYKHNCGGLCCDNYGWWCEENTLEPADSKFLCMADGTIIGEFNTGGVVSIHDLPTSEWYNPMRLTFKNGSSIEALPQKDDTVRGKNHFCNGFRGGKIPTLSEIKGFAAPSLDLSVFSKNGISAKNGGKNSMKFTFYVTEGTRVDKSCNGTIPTMTTTVEANGYSRTAPVGTATCDKADYDMRQGVLEALANMYCDGDFDKIYNKAVKRNELADKKKRTCTYCGKVFDTVEECEAEEAWHVERKKVRRERYLLRKRAKEIAFEEQAQKLAKEIIAEGNKK